MKRILLSFFPVLFLSVCLCAQELWTKTVPSQQLRFRWQKDLAPGKCRYAKLNLAQLRNRLLAAPAEKTTGRVHSDVTMSLPLPDGTDLQTTVVDSPIWEDKDAKAFAGIKTYALADPKSGIALGRITITKEGISGLLFTGDGTVYLNPLPGGEEGTHISYYTKDMSVKVLPCAAKGAETNSSPVLRTMAEPAGRRVYRLAVATTAEYTTWAGGQANTLTYIAIAINNVNAVYNRDLNVKLLIVSPPSIRFTDAATDPYPGGNVYLDNSATDANQTALDNILGTANYDLGIVFNNGWDRGYVPPPFGVACNPSRKGKGAAGVSFGLGLNPTAGPQGQSFDFTLMHEIGHQFGCNHSYASSTGTCTGFGTASSAYEPGSGSTIMGYGGYANCNSYVQYGEMYFHTGSIAEARAYMNGAGNCISPVLTGNTPPVVTVPTASYNLPVLTPFTLSGSGTDVDGNALLYNWEQMDVGLLTPKPPAATNTTGANFRSYPPDPNGNVRTFPRMADILAGVSPTYEVLPSVTRTMHFRLTARDGAAIGGETGEAIVALNFKIGAGPFKLTSQTAAVAWAANSSQLITWNVAATNASPINCTTVNIRFSIDGGLTYPYLLATNTANDGSETITAPNLATSAGRIKIEAVGNIFFNVNSAAVTVTSSCGANGASFVAADSLAAPAGHPSLALTLNPQYGQAFSPAGTITAANPSTFVTMYNSALGLCANYGFNGTFRYATHAFQVTAPGSYTFTPINYGLVYNLYSDAYDPLYPCYNFIASNTTTGAGTTINPSVTATLQPGRRYVLVAGTYSASFPSLPFNYKVNVSGSGIYTAAPSPGAAYPYFYVVVESATNLIKNIAATADLSNAVDYPGGNAYTVYGLSYSNSSPALNTFIGGNFMSLQDALLFNPAYCGNLSRKNKKVVVINQYIFTGNGAWSNAANWAGARKPPSPLPVYSEVIVNPSGDGECVLDVQQATGGGKIIVQSGKKFRVAAVQ